MQVTDFGVEHRDRRRRVPDELPQKFLVRRQRFLVLLLLRDVLNLLNENRNGLIVGITGTEANGTAERAAASEMVDELKAKHGRKPTTLGADKGYDSGEFYMELEKRSIGPHVPLVKEPRDPADVACKKRRAGVEARRRMKERQGGDGYRLSQKCREKIEEVFGWLKGGAGAGRSRLVGRWKLQQTLEPAAAAYNLVRLRKLAPAG